MTGSLYDYREHDGKAEPDTRPWYVRLADRPGVWGFVGFVIEVGPVGAVHCSCKWTVEALADLSLRGLMRIVGPERFLLKTWDALSEYEISEAQQPQFSHHIWQACQWLALGLKNAKFEKGYRRLVQSVNK